MSASADEYRRQTLTSPSSVCCATRAFQQHETTRNHPEHPARLSAIDDLLDAAGLPQQLVAVAPVAVADEEALRRVHDPSLLAMLADAERRAQTERVFHR